MLTAPLDINVIKYKNNGNKFFFDADTGFFAETTDLLDDILDLLPGYSTEEIIKQLENKFPVSEVRELLINIEELYNAKSLFTDKYTLLYEEQKKQVKMSGFPSIWLNVSHDCNLSCIYCFGHGGNYGGPKGLMTVEIAKQCVDYWYDLLGAEHEQLYVTFFGGEPLMNKSVVKFVVDYVQDKIKNTNQRVLFNITTNGTLLKKEVLTFLVKNNIKPLISIDGDASVQNVNRPFSSGKGSYDVIAKNVQRLRKYFNTLEARVTLTHHNVCHFQKTVEHLWELGFTDVTYAFVAIEDKQLSLTESDLKILHPQVQKLADITFANILKQRHRFLGNVLDIAFRIHRGQINRGCEFTGFSTIKFDPAGEMSKCHRMLDHKELNVGNISKGIDWDKYIAININQFSSDKCKMCWVRSFCNGGCAHENYIYNNSFAEPYNIKCLDTKFIVEEGFKLYTNMYIRSPENTMLFFSQ